MLNAFALGNTVAIVDGGLKTEMRMKKDGSGQYEYNEILFRFATKRDYKDTSGQYPTDFILCAIHGPLAKTFAQYCGQLKADGSGKLQSRRLLLVGSVREYTKQVPLSKLYVTDGNGARQILNDVPGFTVRQDGNVFEVDSFEFADANPTANANGAVANAIATTPVTVAPQAVAPAMAPVVPQGIVAQNGPWA